MNDISTAKKSLEKKIMVHQFVTGVGTRQDDNGFFIQVSVSEEHYIPEIQSLLTDGTWEGHPVTSVVQPMAEPHE